MRHIQLTGVGADVELFAQNRKTKQIISAEGLVQGTKYDPFIFDEASPFFATSLDNVLAEFGIPPATNKVEFYNYLQKGIRYLNSTFPAEICVAAIPAAELDPMYLVTEQAQKFGCTPDLNAYTMTFNPRPSSIEHTCLRSGGGHIHLGYTMPESTDPLFTKMHMKMEKALIVKALDFYIGVPSVVLEPDNKRKELYGKAGAYRPKPYGLEYRTLSNYYLQSKRLTYWVYEAVVRAVEWINQLGVHAEDVINGLSEKVESTINNNIKKAALELIEQYDLVSDKRLKLLF